MSIPFPQTPLKIATWNVNSINVRLTHLLNWLDTAQPDIVALQETKVEDLEFPVIMFEDKGYHVLFCGERSYNGVAILSRTPPKEDLTDPPCVNDPQRRIITATINGLRVINLYIPNGQEVASPKYVYKLQWLEKINTFIKEQLQQYPYLVVLGDFNIAPEEKDVHNPFLWEGKVLFSKPERQAFQQLLDLGLMDSFRLFSQPEKSFTWWDYRALAFRRNWGLRIDHILVSQKLAELCTACSIDKDIRKLERPSDHVPVVLTLNHT